jgi:hypothetical protein
LVRAAGVYTNEYRCHLQHNSTPDGRLLWSILPRLATEPEGPLQYGLIAEEVNSIYPELVIRDESGTIQGRH